MLIPMLDITVMLSDWVAADAEAKRATHHYIPIRLCYVLSHNGATLVGIAIFYKSLFLSLSWSYVTMFSPIHLSQ